MQRTEDQIMSKAPIEVTLGATQYQIKPLNIGPQREWRALVASSVGEIVDGMDKVDPGMGVSQIGYGLTATLVKFPEKLADLLFSYSPELKECEAAIIAEATEEQISSAFGKVMQVAYPFVTPLVLLKQVVRRSA